MVKIRLEFKVGAPVEGDFQAVPRIGELVEMLVGGVNKTYEVKDVIHSRKRVRVLLKSPTRDASVWD